MKIKKLFISGLMLASTSAFAQLGNHDCAPGQQVPEIQNYIDLRIAQNFDDLELVQALTKRFCYSYFVNQDRYPNQIFNANSKNMFDYVAKQNPKFKDYTHSDPRLAKRDVLNYFAYLPFKQTPALDDKEKVIILKYYNRFRPKVTLDIFKETNFFDFNEQSKRVILKNFNESVLPRYTAEDIKTDETGSNVYHYAVRFANSAPLYHFQPSGTDLLKKNNFGFHAWHYAFNKKPDFYTDEEFKEEQKKINEYLLSTFNPGLFKFMSFGNPNHISFPELYPFELYLYHFKENNMELYYELKRRYPEYFLTDDATLSRIPFNKELILKFLRPL